LPNLILSFFCGCYCRFFEKQKFIIALTLKKA
jgi:hypothetical protein